LREYYTSQQVTYKHTHNRFTAGLEYVRDI